jgi:hypothetical protein
LLDFPSRRNPSPSLAASGKIAESECLAPCFPRPQRGGVVDSVEFVLLTIIGISVVAASIAAASKQKKQLADALWA